MTAELAVAALRDASTLREPFGAMLNSDRKSQIRSRELVETPRGGVTGSMGRIGAYSDNAARESFFSFLQKNVIN